MVGERHQTAVGSSADSGTLSSAGEARNKLAGANETGPLRHPRQKIFARVGNPTQSQRVQSSEKRESFGLSLRPWRCLGERV